MWARVSAGAIPGFFLSVAAIGLIDWLLPGPWQAALLPCMLAFCPLWVGVICASLKFADGKRAWLWLSAAAIVGLGLLRALQALHWVR